MLPSEYTSDDSLDDARDIAARLGVHYDTVPISGPRAAVTETLAPMFQGLESDITEENIQSRLRGVLLQTSPYVPRLRPFATRPELVLLHPLWNIAPIMPQ